MKNNNCIVSIPKDLRNIESKLLFGLTKRQLIGFTIASVISFTTVIALKDINIDLALYVSFALVAPIFFVVIFKKNNLKAETWIKLIIDYNYNYQHVRRYRITKSNIAIAKERGMKRNVRKKNARKVTPTSDKKQARR